MSRSNSIKSNLAEEGVGSPWGKSTRAETKGAPEGTDGADAVSYFASAVAKMGQIKEAAFVFGLSEQHLGDHLRGDRTIAFHRIVRLCRKNPGAALVLLTELSRIAGLAPPQLIKKQLTAEQKKEARRRFVHRIRAVTLLHEAAVRGTADEMGIDADALDDCLDEVTTERRFG